MTPFAPSAASLEAARAQTAASDPLASAWVDASAGSGKTKVLTDRALRLMLTTGRPDRILCLTFTKAAAAEMANRIVARLAGWAVMSDAALTEALTALNRKPPDAAMLGRAKTLFAEALDAPGGLKVQTVHSFCQGALERFPVEAGAPPGFTALDERAAADLMRRARDDVLRRVMSKQAGATLLADLDRMAERGDAGSLDTAVQALLAERSRIDALGGLAGAVAAALDAFGFQDLAAAEAGLVADFPPNAEPRLRRLAAAWQKGGAQIGKRALSLAPWLAAPPGERPAHVAEALNAFYTQKGEPRAGGTDKKSLSADPDLATVYEAAFDDAERLVELRRAAEAARDTVAALRLADAVGRRYTELKTTMAALDFDDLILKTRDLLEAEGGAGWALYKLDQGVDHILVDEAQDTNPEQWQVIHRLAGEFFQQTEPGARTVFAVGDPKQSIFSFQRADPAQFAFSRARFRDASLAAELTFVEEPLTVSFRSTPAVLTVVDAVFAEAPARRGVAGAGPAPTHRAHRAGLPGRVEWWPLAPKPEADAADPWTPALDYPPASAKPEVQLAEAIAEKIQALIADPTELLPPDVAGGPMRRILAGDIMVVVQRRRQFGDALARALKVRGVPTAGVDRIRLTRQFAARDLLALAQAATLPEDDLSLACFLKSPLGGVDEDELFQLAHGRGRTPLWLRLKKAGETDDVGAIGRAWRLFAGAMARADFAPPFDFFQWALGPMQGRARLVAAMGQAALDPIRELLSLALRHAAEAPASLSGFLAWIEQDAVEIKRALEEAEGVRLLTAHSAKGLQAPIVFLPDTTAADFAERSKLYWVDLPDGRKAPLLGPGRKENNPAVVAAAADRAAALAEEERQRLLYVAMTRAEARLYVAGWRDGQKTDGRGDGCWHELVEAGMRRLDGVREAPGPFGDAPMLVYDDPGAGVVGDIDRAADDPVPLPDLPSWFATPLRAESDHPAAPLAPSGTVLEEPEDAPAALSPLARGAQAAERQRRFGRGLLIHKLLEWLPGVAPADQARVGRAYLARAADMPADEADRILEATISLIRDPAFGAVFRPDAIAEAPIAGAVAGRAYAGVIDRLAVGPERVVIVDFKTNRPPPPGQDATPAPYLRQMAVYRALARQAFPGRPVAAAILWTEAPRLDALDDRLLDAFAPDAQELAADGAGRPD